MSSTINPKAYRFREGIKAIFKFEPSSYSEHTHPEHGYYVLFTAPHGENLTFQQLNALSELLGTDEINFTTDDDGGYDSDPYGSFSYDGANPPEFACFHCKVK